MATQSKRVLPQAASAVAISFARTAGGAASARPYQELTLAGVQVGGPVNASRRSPATSVCGSRSYCFGAAGPVARPGAAANHSAASVAAFCRSSRLKPMKLQSSQPAAFDSATNMSSKKVAGG